MKEGEVWMYTPRDTGVAREFDVEIPSYASLYLVLTVSKIIYLLDLRSGREVPYYDIQEDEYCHGWRKMRA